MNDLSLNDMAFVLGADMDTNVSIVTRIKYVKLLILRKKWTIFLKLETQELNSNKI
jgi:hypothetical protein